MGSDSNLQFLPLSAAGYLVRHPPGMRTGSGWTSSADGVTPPVPPRGSLAPDTGARVGVGQPYRAAHSRTNPHRSSKSCDRRSIRCRCESCCGRHNSRLLDDCLGQVIALLIQDWDPRTARYHGFPSCSSNALCSPPERESDGAPAQSTAVQIPTAAVNIAWRRFSVSPPADSTV